MSNLSPLPAASALRLKPGIIMGNWAARNSMASSNRTSRIAGLNLVAQLLKRRVN